MIRFLYFKSRFHLSPISSVILPTRNIFLRFTVQYNKLDSHSQHSSIAVIDQIDSIRFESIGLTEFAQSMPEPYKVPGDPVQANRNFYVAEKLRFARWTRQT
ncbi:hypothetical protein JW992_06585 [candidate division KSB1 bacterium]|nr:hypothetical protein [candidate division KSB1 bacterium]